MNRIIDFVASLLSWALNVFCSILFRIYNPVKVIGSENLPAQGYIISSNHCSHLDSAVLVYSAGKDFNGFGLVAAFDYWYQRKFVLILVRKALNLIPISRKISDSSFPLKKTLSICKTYIKEGKNLIIYPEGTRSLNGKVQVPLQKGVAVFSKILNLPIVPAYIHGTFYAWPKGKSLIKPCKIYVFFGEPIYPDVFPHKEKNLRNDKAITEQIITMLENQIIKLSEESSYYVDKQRMAT